MNEAERANPSTTIHNQVRGGMLVKILLAAVTLMLLALVAVSRAQDKQNLEGDPFRDEAGRSTKGDVEKVEVVKSHPMLDDAAIAAAKQFKFKPGKQRDRYVKVWMTIPFTFRLKK